VTFTMQMVRTLGIVLFRPMTCLRQANPPPTKLDLVDQLRIRNFRALNIADAKLRTLKHGKFRMELLWRYVVFR
jgi:hypothetical protein